MSDTTTGILVTKKAADEVLNIMKQEGFTADKCFLRVGVRGGGCSGFSYLLDITETKKDSDEEFLQNGVKVVCDPKSLLYLNGTKIDFREEIQGRGFMFENPNSTSSCGCGSSFSA